MWERLLRKKINGPTRPSFHAIKELKRGVGGGSVVEKAALHDFVVVFNQSTDHIPFK